jgi:hypothetical protein
VQLQGEESVFWSVYEETVELIVQGFVSGLPLHVLEAIWLQTWEI